MINEDVVLYIKPKPYVLGFVFYLGGCHEVCISKPIVINKSKNINTIQNFSVHRLIQTKGMINCYALGNEGRTAH